MKETLLHSIAQDNTFHYFLQSMFLPICLSDEHQNLSWFKNQFIEDVPQKRLKVRTLHLIIDVWALHLQAAVMNSADKLRFELIWTIMIPIWNINQVPRCNANFIDLKSLVVWKNSIKSSLDLIMILLPIVINALIGTYIVTFVIVVSTFIIYHLAIG